ncbi:carbohydrate ABC transporter substrate-binding protein (CUT1 family) [Hydrogenispora ethanolica]|uniref:Carbohydrate ABC transporter substrate-binding protein (CUT1 family) n=1 Tax=Hydrogenispora ethanolica TaxID=1082276 RepID=A0A4R1S9U2_HYDET|nr:extracellular solute-binding protein [Hydrogenispora ethanolica]TCL76263.1 carbohydrate ABC transporter substrate-binding protein (CUT1 family) [Hydrogenispora ethanolica]
MPKVKWQLMLGVCLLVLLLGSLGAVEGAAGIPKDYRCTLTTWGWDENYWNHVTAAFNKIYPNIKFEYTPVANGDYLQKEQTSLAAGTPLPDIPWAIIDSRGRAFELDMWEALNKPPYRMDPKAVFSYLLPIMKNSKGEICGIEQGINPAAMAYRRDLAQEYLGTDDPDKLAKLLPDWDAFIKKGKEVRAKSGGKVFMMQGIGDIKNIIREQDPSPWVVKGTVNATRLFKPVLAKVVQFRDAQILDKLEPWTPAWYASYGQGKHIFAGCAIWSPQYVIEPNDKNGKGHWGLMNCPGGNFSWGGTTLGISKQCKHKLAAWEFVKFATLSVEGAKAAREVGFLTSYKAAYADPGFASIKDDWFAGQDLGKFWTTQVAPRIKIRPMTKYDNLIKDSLDLITTSLNNDPGMTVNDAMQKLIAELKNRLPDLTIK